MGMALMGSMARAETLSHEYARLADTVATGASRCHRIVEWVTLDPFRGREMSAALEYRVGCIGDLAASLGRHGGLESAAAPGGEVGIADRADGRVAAALSELNTAIAHATCVLEEGTRLRTAQREIIADIQYSLLRTERQVRNLAADTNAMVRHITGVVAGR